MSGAKADSIQRNLTSEHRYPHKGSLVVLLEVEVFNCVRCLYDILHIDKMGYALNCRLLVFLFMNMLF